MLPLRDNIPSRTFPAVTVLLIAANAVLFLYEVSLPQEALAELITRYGMIPRRLTAAYAVGGPTDGYWTLVSAMFLHGGWLHVIGNMLFLWVFGDNVEDLTGRLRFLFLYLATGVVGNLAHVATNPLSPVPTIGASGAVAGILGAYLVNFSYARVLTLVPLGIFLTTLEIPAAFFLVVWFAMQLLSGLASLGVPAAIGGGGTAWWAHVGGFLAGAVLVRFLRRRRPRPTWDWE